MDEDQIKAFATQFDPQPFHLDDAAAEGTRFGGLAASGWHTAAITMKLLVEAGGGAPPPWAVRSSSANLPAASGKRSPRAPRARSQGRVDGSY